MKYLSATGTYPTSGSQDYDVGIDFDYIWEQMHVRPKPVIIICGFCKSHNAIDNPTCIQCGAPMGYGAERK